MKTAAKPRRPVVHNTVSIPDHMVMANSDDIPEISIKLNFDSIEERTKGEVFALIEHMNKQGKFVSKEWVCNKLNFKERKADNIFVALKREGKIEDYFAVRGTSQRGTFWRVTGKAMRREMQRVHAAMRRNLRASLYESIYSPKGSLNDREDSQTISSNRDNSNEEFVPAKKVSLRHQSVSRNYEDGSSGNGLNGTQYTEAGCFDRLTDPDSNPVEYKLIEKLCEVSVDGMLTPAAARSAARRLDSGVINTESVIKMCEIIRSKDLALSILDIIRNFEQLLQEYVEKIRPGELDYIEEQIRDITQGTSEESVYKEIALASKTLKELDYKEGQLTYQDYYNFVDSYALPVYSKLVVLSLSKHFKPSILKLLAVEFEQKLFAEITANRSVYELLINLKKFNFIDWSAFAQYRRDAVASLRCTLFVNKLRNRKLDEFSVQLNFIDKLYAHGDKQHAWACIEHNTPGDTDVSGGIVSNSRTSGCPERV